MATSFALRRATTASSSIFNRLINPVRSSPTALRSSSDGHRSSADVDRRSSAVDRLSDISFSRWIHSDVFDRFSAASVNQRLSKLMDTPSMAAHRGMSTAAVNNEAAKAPVNVLRPLSPHLPVYKPQTNSTSSIFNRISGIYLTAVALSFHLLYLKTGSICLTYGNYYQFLFYSSKLNMLTMEISALALIYHVYKGIQHLVHDTPWLRLKLK